MNRLPLFVALCLAAGCGTKPSVTSQTPPPPGDRVEAADGVTDAEKKAFQDFLRRKLPDTDGLEVVEWKVGLDGNHRNISASFRAKNNGGNKVMWTGVMTVQGGKISSKVAYTNHLDHKDGLMIRE